MVTEQKLSPKEFVIQAVKNLRKPPYKGIHCVYSGFNQAYRTYFGTDPVIETKKLADEGVIKTAFVKGGIMIYLAEDAPERQDPGKVVDRILGK